MVWIEMIFPLYWIKKIYKVKERLCRKFSKETGIEMQSQHWVGNRQLSLEGFAVE